MAVLLSAAMVLSSVNIGPLYASEDHVGGTIIDFDELGNKYMVQELAIGADETDIEFPDTLWVDLVVDDAVGGDDEAEGTEHATISNADRKTLKASSSDADEDEFYIELINDLEIDTEIDVRQKIQGIEWILNTGESAEPEFDSDMAGVYVYEPVMPSGYEVHTDAVLPQIMVLVGDRITGLSLTTDMVDGILTIADVTKASGEGWNWKNGNLLDVNSKFLSAKQIIFADGLEPTFDINTRTVTLEPEGDNPAIIATKDLIITSSASKDGFGNLIVKGVVEAPNVTIKGYAKVVADGKELFHLADGSTLSLAENATLTSANGGSIYLAEGASVEGLAGVFSDQGKAFTDNGLVTVLAADAPAADNQLTEGLYIGAGAVFTKAGSGETITTGMVDGILTIADTVKANGEGWNWNNGNLLDVNSKFTTAKQIIFASGLDPTFNVNTRTVTLEPEDDNPAISVTKDLIITSTASRDGFGNLIVKGAIKALNITITGYAKVVADGKELFRLDNGNKLTLAENATLTGTGGGSIYLSEGAKVEGMAGVFSDQGKAFTENGVVTVVAADTPAADNQLTEGSYIGTGTIFSKAGSGETIMTGMVDGVLTIADTVKASGEGWNWKDGNLLDVSSKFTTAKQIVFAAGLDPTFNLNTRTVTLEPEGDNPAITATKDLIITSTVSKAGFGNLIVKGAIKAVNVTITGYAKVVADGKELFRLEDGNTLTLAENATLTGTGGGSIYLAEGAKIAGMAGVFSDQGTDFTDNGVVTVVAANVPAADNQLTEGSYVASGSTFNKGGSSIEPAETGLKDGILTITKEKGGVSEEGWGWNGWRLDINDKFTGNKQIVFASGITPTIKVNRAVTITPEAGTAAIMASGELTITADTNVLLTAGGPIEANSVIIKGSANVAAHSIGDKAAIRAKNGIITISDAAAVTTGGAIEATGNITIDGSASVVVSSDRPTASIYAKSGKIMISGTATAIASNHSGAAMNPAPDTGSYENLSVTASESTSGRPTTEYHAANINNYKYLKLEKLLTLSEIEGRVEALDANASPAMVAALADQIRSLSAQDRVRIKPEVIDKVDQLLQKATNIQPDITIEVLSGMRQNKQIQNAEICGALLAAGITSADDENTGLVFKITQKQPENGAVLSFECELFIDGTGVKLIVPVTVTIELPPEFYPLRGYKIHHTGDGIDEWMDFIYNGADNTTQFRTNSFSTFSIVNTSSSSGSGGSGGSGGGGGGGGGGGSRSLTGSTAPAKEAGRWIQDTTGWWFQYNDKNYPKDGWAKIRYGGKDEWYYFDQNGYMVTGWVVLNGNWYYLSTASDGTIGIMLTGWQIIDGKRYYFSEAIDGTAGIKLTNIRIGEYYLDQDGVAR